MLSAPKSSRLNIFLRTLLLSTPDREHSIRWASCCLDISRLKIATGTFFIIAMCSAMLTANAVLPIDGRAAMMIISPACRPLVISSSSKNPDSWPVTIFPSMLSSRSSVSRSSTPTSLAWSSPFFSANSKICVSARSSSSVTGSSLV